MHREVLPGLQGGRNGLEMAEVVGLEGVMVASAERGPRLDHPHTYCVYTYPSISISISI